MNNKWTIGKKLIVSFMVVAAITLILGLVGFYGAVQSAAIIESIGHVRLPAANSLLIIKENAENIRGTMRTLAIPGLDMEMRERQYGNLVSARERYQPEYERYEGLPHTAEEKDLWAKFETAWNAWRAENNKFIEMCRQIDTNGIQNPLDLDSQLESFTKDHYALVQRVLHLIYRDDAVFDGGDDHTACNAGRWMPTFKTENPILQKMLVDFVEPHRRFHDAIAEIKAFVQAGDQVEAEAVYASKMIPAMQEVFGQFEAMLELADNSITTQEEAEAQVLGPLADAQRAAIALLDQLVDLNTEAAEQEVTSGTHQAALLRIISIVAMIAGVLVAILLGILISRGINSTLRRIAASLGDGADQTATAAGQVAQSSTSMAEGASQQASSLEETSASLEEITAMTKQNADNANQARNLAAEANSGAEKGTQSMKRMSQAIDDIKKSSDETAKIIKTIDEIAFQTNLLALNAAVEAARAGDAGKGFAVVAEEVRNLAQRSAEAARTTAAMIEGSVANAGNGVQISQEVAEALGEITTVSGKVNALINEIAQASIEQAKGIEQVNEAMAQMDQVTQANAANAEESASASEELSAQASEMNRLVQELVAMVGGVGSVQTGPQKTSGRQGRGGHAHTGAARPAPRQLASGHKPHQLTKTRQGGQAVINPEQVIPLDDEDMGDF